MKLNSTQKFIVEFLKHCLVIACPGSGKTNVLAHKAEHILRLDSRMAIMIATFTRDSAADIRKRIAEVAGKDSAQRVETGTFHSLIFDQLKQAGYRFNIVNEAQTKQYIRRAMESCGLKSFDLNVAAAYIEKCKTNPDFVPANDDLGRLFSSYEKLLRMDDAIDFSGMVFKAVSLMRLGELKPIPCDYLFVDEAQDMDLMQFAWCAEHIKAGAIFTVVGDDDQSIYRFRGAGGVKGMLRFQTDFDARIIRMGTNYRCHNEILDAARKVIANNSERIEKELTADKGEGGSVEIWQCFDATQEAKLIVKKIKEACKDNENNFPEKCSVGIMNKEWAVLARNKHNLNVVAAALSENKIPYTYQEKDEWSEEPVCFALQLLSSLDSGVMAGLNSAMHFSGIDQVVLAECFNYYDDDLEMFLHESREYHLVELGHDLHSRIHKFIKAAQIWERDLKKERIEPVIKSVFSWFIDQLNLKNIQDGKSYKREIKSLTNASKKLSGMKGALKRRLQLVMIGINSDKNGNKLPAVFLGTLHSAKGLEFKYTWIVQANHEIIPDEMSFSWESIEEERRLFYVGITRAKISLFISCTGRPSQFIDETGVKLKYIFDVEGFESNVEN